MSCCNGERKREKRWVVRGTMDGLSIREADCIRVEGGWLCRVDCCSTFVPDSDADKLYTSPKAAEKRVKEIVEQGGFPDV